MLTKEIVFFVYCWAYKRGGGRGDSMFAAWLNSLFSVDCFAVDYVTLQMAVWTTEPKTKKLLIPDQLLFWKKLKRWDLTFSSSFHSRVMKHCVEISSNYSLLEVAFIPNRSFGTFGGLHGEFWSSYGRKSSLKHPWGNQSILIYRQMNQKGTIRYSIIHRTRNAAESYDRSQITSVT